MFYTPLPLAPAFGKLQKIVAAWLLLLAVLHPLFAVLQLAPAYAGSHRAQAPVMDSGLQASAFPPFFVPLASQPGAGSSYQMLSQHGSATFSPGEMLLSIPQPGSQDPGAAAADLRLQFVNARPDQRIEAGERLPGVVNVYRGSAAENWRAGIPTYASLTYQHLYDGIDLVYDGKQGVLKGTYYVEAGADPSQIRWRYQGAEQVRYVARSGELHLQAGDAWLVERAPLAWQIAEGVRRPVAVRYAQHPDGSLGFTLGKYDASLPLVIDPELVFGTYLGGSSEDYGRAVAVDQDGFIYVVGDFWSTNFLGANTSGVVNNDVILVKLNPDGKGFQYLTFIGGPGYDDGLAVALAPGGAVYLSADPFSGEFPSIHPITLPADDFSGDGMLVKLDATGAVLYSTPLGMNFTNEFSGRHIAVDQDGNVYVAGEGYNPYYVDRDAVIKKINAAGSSISQITRLAGNSTTRASAIALGPNGKIYITGSTDNWNDDLPLTPGAVQAVCGAKLGNPDAYCEGDGFLLVYSAAGTLSYGTYLGGASSDQGRAVAVDSAGNIYIAGDTGSKNFPTVNALKPACTVDPAIDSCYFDTFVVKLTADGLSRIYSTYLTSSEKDRKDFVTGLVVDGAGSAYLTGFTNGDTFPVKDAFQPQLTPGVCLTVWEDRLCFDAFVTRLNPDGTLGASSYLGGSFDEYSGGITLDPSGNVLLVGYTKSSNFPTTTGVLQPNASAGSNFYLAKVGTAAAPPPPPPPPPPGLNIRIYLPITIR